LKEGGRGAATAAVLAAAGLAAEGKAGQARALALDALDRRPLFGGHCSRSCRDALSRLAALHGMTAADVDGAFRAAALPLYPGWSDFDDAVHWNTARHALAMETVVAAARRVPGLKGLPWKDAAIRAKLPADGTRTLYAFSALTRASPEGPPPAAVLALERALREDPKALDGGRDALLARVSGRGGFLAAWGGRIDVRPAAWDWAEGLARLQAGDAAGALAPLRSAASAHPGRPEPRLHLAAALLRAGRAAEADAELERLLDGAGDRTRELALAGLALGSRSPALREAAKPPLEERLAALRARALSLQLRDPAAALPLFDELLAARPGDADLLADRGVCRALAGRKPDAEADLRAALRARPGHKAAEASLHALGLKP
jgi:tetratricopeptide (TPR) repeat protein